MRATARDLSNATLNLNAGTGGAINFGFNDGITGATLKVGALTGNGAFQGSYNLSGPNTLQVGFLNSSTSFSGIIGGNAQTNRAFAKFGTGTLTLSYSVFMNTVTLPSTTRVVSRQAMRLSFESRFDGSLGRSLPRGRVDGAIQAGSPVICAKLLR